MKKLIYILVFIMLFLTSCYKYDNPLDIEHQEDCNKIRTPEFSPAGGVYAASQVVTITCETDRTNIYYTVDGTEPTKSSTPYQSPISINSTTTLKAKAFDSWNELIPFESFISSATYTINLPAVATPSFSLESGTYTTHQTASISCSTSGASIHYTTDGADPTESSNLYSSPIRILGTTTLKAKAFKANHNPSSIATALYTMNLPTVANPSISLPSGTYTQSQTTGISCSTSGASIRYTTSGADPTESSLLYTSPITIPITTTLKVKAFKANFNPSAIVTATYTINLPTVATPSISLASGTYTGSQTTRISCSTNGASIRYTTNGIDPTESSTLYTSPVSISITTTLKAKAFKLNYNPSATASASYTIMPVPIWVDHFNDLSAWSNTSNLQGANVWYISYLPEDGYSGTGAVSYVSGGYEVDTLTRSFFFATNVVLKVWLKTQTFASVSVIVDGQEVIHESNIPSWVQKQCNISSGQHTISIQTRDGGGWGFADELEIFSSN